MRRLRWLPNAITVLRILGLPVLAYFVAVDPGPTSIRAGVCFGVIGITDVIDGNLARLLDARTRFGRIADPLADRLLLATGLVGLIALGRFSWPGPVIILARDVIAVGAFAVLASRGRPLRVDALGKASSATAMCGTGLAMLTTSIWADALFWTAVALCLISLVHYARTVWPRARVSAST
ncbi:MAG TPA: CDP-alcohol phosphatidyltransferase family protein [Miltoncostaeaceae bacterium]|nr:CDP-alcohol phosphatidyltransferase family protein [Miltoncostaeaceae bacterium]